mmetsp:Transcript_10399/g.12181  ORF Transcript_10399/g.12181 Transcript_10399/m.12181 type:complete len:250 (+) Transcript_10399:1062-1811(+)
MQRIERVESDHILCLFRKSAVIANHDLVHVFVVSPSEVDFVKSTVWLVDAVLCVVTRVVDIWTVREVLRKDNSWVEGAADWVSITNSGPLLFPTKYWMSHDLSEIMNKARQVHPVIFFPWIGFPATFSGLQQMFNLREVQVRVALIHYLVKKLGRFPDSHNLTIQGEPLLVHLLDKLVSLVLVMCLVKLVHLLLQGCFVLFIVAEATAKRVFCWNECFFLIDLRSSVSCCHHLVDVIGVLRSHLLLVSF